MKWSLILFCYPFLALCSENLSDYAVVESPYVVEGNRRLDLADQSWANFQDEIIWFLKYSKPSGIDQKQDDDSDDLAKQRVQQYNDLLQAVEEVQAEFIKFRTKIGNCALSNMESSPDQFLSFTLSILNVTHWYTDYMKEMLFPQDWRALYENYVNEKRSNN